MGHKIGEENSATPTGQAVAQVETHQFSMARRSPISDTTYCVKIICNTHPYQVHLHTLLCTELLQFFPKSKFAWTLLILHVTFVVLYFLLVSYDSSADAAHVENQDGHSHHLEENLKKYPGAAWSYPISNDFMISVFYDTSSPSPKCFLAIRLFGSNLIKWDGKNGLYRARLKGAGKTRQKWQARPVTINIHKTWGRF